MAETYVQIAKNSADQGPRLRRGVLPIATTVFGLSSLLALPGCGKGVPQVEMAPTPDYWAQQTEHDPIRKYLYEGEDLKILPQSTSQAIERKFKGDITQAMIFDISQRASAGYVIDETQNNASGISFDLYSLSNDKMVGVFPSENGNANMAEVVGIDEITNDGYVYRTLKIIVNNNGKDEEHTFIAFGFGQVKTAYNISSLDKETQQALVESQIKNGRIESIVFGNPYLSSPNTIVWIEDEKFQGQRDVALTGGFQNINYKVQFVSRPQEVITPILSTNTPKPTEKPTETPTPTPTEVPLPSQFLAQAQEHGLIYKVVDGKVMVNSTDGKSVEVDPSQVADWPIWENNYLVIKGDNGIPQLRYVEGKGWERVEQTSMIDAFGNTVPGWVVETSPIWEGEPTQAISTELRVYDYDSFPEYGLNYGGMTAVNLRQWKLVEFVTVNGIKMQSLVADFTFLNAESQIITVRVRSRDIDFIGSIGGFRNARGFIDSLTIGGIYFPDFIWGATGSTLSPQELAKISFESQLKMSPPPPWLDQVPCKTEAGCSLETGQLGAKKFSQTYLRDIANGVYGNFVDLSENARINQFGQ